MIADERSYRHPGISAKALHRLIDVALHPFFQMREGTLTKFPLLRISTNSPTALISVVQVFEQSTVKVSVLPTTSLTTSPDWVVSFGSPGGGREFATFDFTPFQTVVYLHRASWFEAHQCKIPRCHLGLLRQTLRPSKGNI